MKVSIVITNYNYEKYLDRAIRSAFVQNFPDDRYEIVIVDDGSTDNSKKIIHSYRDNIRSVFHEENYGLSAARNTGISHSRGEYIVFLDSDDFINRQMIHVQSLFLDMNKDMHAVSCDYYNVDENEIILERKSPRNDPIACGVMYRRETLFACGLFDKGFLVHEDKDFRIRYLRKFKIYNIDLPLYRYRKHKNSLTTDMALNQAHIKKLITKFQVELG